MRRDVDILLWSMRLTRIRRFTNQRFWENETQAAFYAAKVESQLPLESVADHSWHVADCILLLSGHCSQLDVAQCLRLAIMHDKMEIAIEDWSPLGRDGTGNKSHAFNRERRIQKEAAEKEAITHYVARLRPEIRDQQESLLLEALECKTRESRFVKAVDRLQALAFVYAKKQGDMRDRHVIFTLRYSEQAQQLCPELTGHYTELRRRLIQLIAKKRNASAASVEQKFSNPPTLPLFDNER